MMKSEAAGQRQDLLSQSDLAKFVGAAIGAAFGAFVALAIACAIFPQVPPAIVPQAGVLEWAIKSWGIQSYVEDREKGFFVLTLLLGGVAAALGARWKIGGARPTALSWVVAAASVPMMNEVARRAMIADAATAAAYALTAAAILVFPALFTLRRGVPARLPGSGEGQGSRPALQAAAAPVPPPGAEINVFAVLATIAVIAALLFPFGVRSVARAIGYEMHMAVYMIGPATYGFAKGLIPGIDYYTQYSIGTPWLFSHLLARSGEQTMVNAVWFTLAEMAVFELTLVFFLAWFLRSWAWALVVGVAILMTQFTTPDPLYAPSSTASRYPLLIVVAWRFVIWTKHDLATSRMPWLAFALAASLFLNTETGVYASVAVAVAAIVTMPGWARAVRQVVALGVATLAAFMLLSFAAFGSGVFDSRFLVALFEPMLLYGRGLAAVQVDWSTGWSWLYNVISPGVALASAGWAAAVSRQSQPTFGRDHIAALMFVSLCALFLSAKYINMSLAALWLVNSWGFLVVGAWWARRLVDLIGEVKFSVKSNVTLARGVVTAGMAAVLLLLLVAINDARNPSLYAIASYRTFPSILNKALRIHRPHPCVVGRTGCSLSRAIAAQDVALIRRLTQPGERVALFGLQDWVYLVEARRASRFVMLPSTMIFTQHQLRQSAADLDLVFLPRTPAETLGIDHHDLAAALVPELKQSFAVIGEGADLLAWKRVR